MKTVKQARWAIAPVALTGLAMLVTACGSPAAPSSASSPSSPSSTAVSSAPASTGSASTGSGATATPTAGTSMAAAAGGKPACRTSALALHTGASQGAAGSTYTELDFTNISHATCTLYGYPGVSFTGGANQIGVAAADNASPPRRLVTLAPGAVAGALLRIVDARNFAIAACNTVTAHTLRVYPPNQLTPLYVAFTAPTCSNGIRILTVSVVQAGAGNAS